jgi:hypothetical protein
MRESPLYQEIAAEGAQNHARKAVLQALPLRFGQSAASEFTDAVNRLENVEQLDALHKIAILCRRISQFRRAIAAL